MKYIIRETYRDERLKRTAGVKARDDFETIAKECGYKIVELPLLDPKLERGHLTHISVYKVWKDNLQMLKEGDSLLIQMPLLRHSIFINSLIRKLKKKVKVYALIHDLELFRIAVREGGRLRKMRTYYEELGLLKKCDGIIVHNSKMKQKLRDFGVEESKIVELGIFDYLSEAMPKDNNEDRSVIIAGNLRRYKSGYVYNLPEGVRFNLYGIDYDGEQNDMISYKGSFPPEILPSVVEGMFGLVWDGESADTCSGVYGDYLRINNPHKTSFYLSCGIPVLIWKEAALADFIIENGCGIVLNSLSEISAKINNLDRTSYIKMKENANQISGKLKMGWYSRNAIEKVEKNCMRIIKE